ncbi:sigma-54 dependent transcriptional regulator [Rurimicrobium arvi]|uniref:Sigma-54 dependent transcriptional regulator n=1 Tax=Rurimicrobium arvi TaxID=2049916 RepID=A0ABP8MM37_9BACT
MSHTVLVIDDERAIRASLSEILSFEGYKVEEASDGAEGLKKILANAYDCVICDIKMPKMDGLEVLEKVMAEKPDTQIIIISGHGNIETAVEAVKKGAFDYISKPPDLNRLLITLRNAMERKDLVVETKQLRKKVEQKIFGESDMIGNSEPLQKIRETLTKIAPTEARVLITGENGVGKELVARNLHKNSNRAKGPMIEVNCAAIPSELIESELFGHEKGSFTSAVKTRIGKFEQANGGTLFLDEIGDMSLDAQAKVLRALQEGKITRVGGDTEIKVDVRVIAATNKDLLQEVNEKRFRLDLYHRLGVILIHVPSLNQRREDIPLLIDHFLNLIATDYNQPVKEIDNAAVQLLSKHNWTGNIRELKNVVERLIILSDKKITKDDVETYILMK